jgi:hypothetical protein
MNIALAPNSPAIQLNTNRTNVSKNREDAPMSANMVDMMVDKTYLGANYTAASVSGAGCGIGAFATSAPGAALKTTVSLIQNLRKAEKLGPNLTFLGCLAAAPVVLGATAIGLPVSMIAGMVKGAGQVDSSKPRDFCISQAGSTAYSKVSEGWKNTAESCIRELNDFGAEKLEPGQKAFDIPIMATVKTVAMGAAGLAIGGIVGAVTAVASSVRESVSGVVHSFQDETLNIGGKFVAATGAAIGGVVQGVTYGIGSAVTIAAGAVSSTWKNDSLVSGGKTIAEKSKNCIGAAFSPKATLTEEKPAQTAA